jgi:carbon storage regulator
MLILSRKLNEKIMIGDDVSISIIEIRGDQVKLGVDAPRSVKVFRREVFDAIMEENLAAADSNTQLPDVNLGVLREPI